MSVSNSWRLEVLEKDRSQTVATSINVKGAMVIRANKGTTKPIFINPRQEDRIIRLFGKPTATLPDVLEVIEYNKIAPIWVSAPYASTDTHGGVLVSTTGTSALGSGLTDADISTGYSFGDSDYMVIRAKSPMTDDLAVLIVKDTYREGDDDELDIFDITLYQSQDGLWYEVADYQVCLDENGKDSYGKNIYIGNVIDEDNDYIQVEVNTDKKSSSIPSFSDDSAKVAFAGGSRTTAIDDQEYADGWDYFKKPRLYEANIFMDPTGDDSIPAIFNTLRNSYQKYSTYLITLPSGEDVSTAISTKQGYSIDNAGLAFYWNHGKVQNFYAGSAAWSSLIGRVGYKHAQMVDIYNGGAPAWIDEDGHGGQLGSGILEMEYDPTETELQQLDTQGVNAIVYDPGYGVMITSQRTAQSPSKLSDNSWIAHRRMFDYIIKNVLDQVLVQQIVKLNDDVHRQIAKTKTNLIMSGPASANLISNYAVVCDENNNTEDMLAQRYFVLDVVLKVTPYSEKIRFNFTNIDQTASVDEYVG